MRSTAPAIPTAEKICGIARTPTQPTMRYAAALSQRGESSQTSSRTSPSTAPLQTITSTSHCVLPSNRSSAKGVYVPAMKTKIIEWSSRRAQTRLAALFHGKRW